MDKKRIFFIVLFILATIGIGYMLYAVFFAAPKALAPTPGTTPIPGSEFPQAGGADRGDGRIVDPDPTDLPTSGGSTGSVTTGGGLSVGASQIRQVSQVVDANISDADVRSGGTTPRFYNQQDGKFYQLNGAGQASELSDEVFFNVDNVVWSPSNNESIIEYPDGSNIFYDFDTKQQVTLPKHWEEFSFTKKGDKIAAKSLGLSPENRWLVSSDPNGNNIELIEPLGNNADKVIVDWSPNKQIVGMSLTGQSFGADRQEVLFVGKNGENFKSTIVEGRDLRTEWSETGSKLLYSVHNARNDFKPELWVVGGQGDNIGSGRKLLNVDTWADKCTFTDDRFVFCGVPQSLEKGSGFAPSLADTTPDDIYKIDVQTGLKTKIQLDDFHVVKSMNMSEDGKTLFFTDKNLPGLFSVSL